MFKDIKRMVNVLVKVKQTRDNQRFIMLLVNLLNETLSLNDFNILLQQLEDEIENG